MKIQQKRIRNIERHLPVTFKEKTLHIGAVDIERFRARLLKIGFTGDLAIGETVLPDIVGPITRFNAEGKQIIRRDLPKETVYRQIIWKWKEWHGKEQVEKTDFKYVPYQRYPREPVPPPGVELQIAEDSDSNKLITSESIVYTEANYTALVHLINIYLEIFGECDILTEDLHPIMPLTAQRLNWEVLPPGEYPWEEIKEKLRPIIERAKTGKQGVITRRLEVMSEAEPELIAYGNGGFSGYIVFGFKRKNIYILENSYYGNATYVFDQNWEQISQLTKAEILNQNLHIARLIHVEGWEGAIRQLLD